MAKKKLSVPLAILLCLSGAAAAAPGNYETEAAKLEQLRANIERIRRDLSLDQSRRGGISAELREIDRKVGESAARLRQLDERRSVAELRVAELRKALAAQAQRARRQRQFLSRQLVSAYAGGRQAALKLLLNQEDPARVDRMLAYHRYFNQARVDAIAEAVGELRRLSELEASLRGELDGLAQLQREQRTGQHALAAARAERAAVLTGLDASIAANDRRLAELRADERQLQRLLDGLRNALADIPDPDNARGAFKSRRGNLAWPLDGELSARFGERLGVGDMRWSGVQISAKEGSGVHAVAPGQVVFADWLRGFGLLLIIDHGDGFMTLYGHNEAIYKSTGDWVQAGDAVATVGASGGRHQTGLYFEIRARGKPVDPMQWLRARRGS